jgi:hypothetical protein
MFATIFSTRLGTVNGNLNFIGTVRHVIVPDVYKQNVPDPWIRRDARIC